MPFVMRPSLLNYIIFIALGLLVTVPFLGLVGGGPAVIGPLVVVLGAIWAAIMLFLAWMSLHVVTLTADRLVYRAGFSRRAIALGEIASVAVIPMSRQRGRYGTMTEYALMVQSRDGAASPLRIALKPFAKKQVGQLLALLSRANSAISVDDPTRQFTI